MSLDFVLHLLLSHSSFHIHAHVSTHILHTQVTVNFTEPLYPINEDVGTAAVALTITAGDANRDGPIVVTVNSADFTAIGKHYAELQQN